MLLRSITTDELLQTLAARGLRVTRNMLAKDVEDYFLPSPQIISRGPYEGVYGLWETEVARRAVYLYRLRKRGMRGSIIKVLLFIKDGWGWDEVQPICLAGLHKLARLSRGPVLRDMRNPTIPDVMLLADDGIEMKPQLARLFWGIEFFGQSLEGGSVKPICDALYSVAMGGLPSTNFKNSQLIKDADQKLKNMHIDSKTIINIVDQTTSHQADIARVLLNKELWTWRGWLHSYSISNNIKKQSTNLLTFCGRTTQEIAKELRSLPGRITVAQFLAAQLLSPFLILIARSSPDEVAGLAIRGFIKDKRFLNSL
jgi:hypothetical protein